MSTKLPQIVPGRRVSVIEPAGVGCDVRRWAVVAGLFVSLAILFGGGFVVFGLFFHPLVNTFHWTHTRISMLITVECLAIAVFSPVVGWVLEWVQPRFVVATGAILATIAYLTAAGATSFLRLLFSFGLIGIALSCSTFVPASLVIAQWFRERRSIAMGIVISGAPFGGLVMSQMVSTVILSSGWRAAYRAIAIVTVFVVPLAILVIRNELVVSKGTEQAVDLPGYTVQEGLHSRALWFLMGTAFCYGFIVTLGLSHFVEYLIVIGFRPRTAAFAFKLLMLTGFLGCVAAGWIGDLLGSRLILTLALLSMMAGYMSMLDPYNPILMAICQFGFGFSGAVPTAFLMLVLADAVGLRHVGFFSGLVSLAMTFGNATGPVVGGLIFDIFHNYGGALESGAMMAMLAALSVIMLPTLQFASE